MGEIHRVIERKHSEEERGRERRREWKRYREKIKEGEREEEKEGGREREREWEGERVIRVKTEIWQRPAKKSSE